jgi:hypothetical protein
MSYTVFHRTWWRKNSDWPNGLEPAPGRQKFIATVETEEEAQALCKQWCRDHAPGVLSDKAEYTSAY